MLRYSEKQNEMVHDYGMKYFTYLRFLFTYGKECGQSTAKEEHVN